MEGSLKQIQAIILGNMPRRNYLEYSRSYSDQLSGFSDLEAIERAAMTIDEADWQPVISHHDLLFENILYNDQGSISLTGNMLRWDILSLTISGYLALSIALVKLMQVLLRLL